MDAVVAVYSDWGIGAAGTQPVTVSADRVRFRELTTGHGVIVGRETLADFPGGRPLKNRQNIVITRQNLEIPGAIVVHSGAEALDAAAAMEQCFVIGGASVYRELFPALDRVFVTKVEACPVSDSFFPNLDELPDWTCAAAEPWQEENGIRYQFCVYEKRKAE